MQEKQSDNQSLKVTGQLPNPYKSDELSLPGLNDKIGPNKIQAIIGEGGSAQVFRVWHEGLEVVRAVKVLKKYSVKEARERFMTEAKILADIHHPNIIEIHNIGYFNQKIPFIEMEFVEGVSIKTLLAQSQRFPVQVALSIAYFLCQALHYAHTKDYTLYGKVYRGLIHRDIKPENVFISNDGIVKLMDFGIARPSEVSLHTVGAKIMGTLVYLSPEQLSGSQLDHRSDIFSLGTVLYEMISGKRAFPQKTLTEIVQKKTKGSYQTLASLGIPLPAGLNAAVEKSMALTPQDRFDTIAEFGNTLFSILRTISDRSPFDNIQRFLTDPSSIPDWASVPSHTKKTHFPWVAVTVGTAALFAGAVVFLLLK